MAYSQYAVADFDACAPQLRRSTLASISRTLGLIGLGAWLLPIVGLPITFLGFILGIVSLKDGETGRSIRTTLLCTLGLVLTIVNGALGFYMAVHAQAKHTSSPQQITNPHVTPPAAAETPAAR